MLRYLLVIPALLLFITVYGQKAKDKHAKKVNYKTEGAPLPPLRILTTDGRTLTEKDLDFKGNLIFMLFNPTCEHCEDQTEVLKKNMGLFKKSHLLMVCPGKMKDYLSDFEKVHSLARYPAIMSGRDDSHIIDDLFLYKPLPQINVYNTNHKLIKIFFGDTPIDSLKPYIQ